MENTIIQIISTLIQSITATYYCYTLAKIVSKNKFSKKNIILTFLLLFFTIGTLALINLKENYSLSNTIIGILILVIIMKFTLNMKILKAILTSILYYVIQGITEILSFAILNAFLEIDIELFLTANKELLMFLIVQTILNFIVITLLNIKSYYNKVFKQVFDDLSIKNIKMLIIMIIAYIIPQVVIFAINHYSYSNSLLIVNTIQIILVSCLIFLYFKSVINKEKLEAELYTTELHNKTLIEIVDGVRTLKHDYGNIIQALNGYVVTKKYDRLHEYVDSLLKEFGSVNNISAIDPKIFNEPAIYGVVGAKYFYATEHDITFEIEVTSNIKNISFSKPELSRILGILLDNAIEATQKAEKKYIKLEISFNDKKYADVVRIINTYDTSIEIDLDEIYEKGISSKEVKSGIGLWEVKKLVNKNKHSQIYATIEKNKFVQNLIIERID